MRTLAAIALLLVSVAAHAGEVLVAVAANFSGPLQKITAAFEADTKNKVKVAVGSTGSLAAQIKGGAPFEVFLSADEETPARFEREGLTALGWRFTYASGRLVLWSAKAGYVDGRGEILMDAPFAKIAIADPKLAPYGSAAVQTMQRMGVYERVRPKIVQAENIGQAYQFVASGNAQLGFVAMSQVFVDGRLTKGSAWIVPRSMHIPLKQAAVVLKRGEKNPVATQFAEYLKGDKARGIIASYGYELPGSY